ncbi:MAG: hypothetical protein MZV65_39750 [Chromatiales bacterium]|nr:hypothetical protein [Chromatiales bacterium]MCK7581171.1 hypothetical protein [Chromatiales bacterium]
MSESICNDCEHYRHTLGALTCTRYLSVATDGVKECNGYKPDRALSRVQTKPELTVADLIRQECAMLRDVLLSKNAKYGNSALEPVRVFSKADPVEQIRVRLDDKLSRLMRGQGIEDEDVELDLMGYLILLRVARRLGDVAQAQHDIEV